jgi:hypothetical protein
MVAHYFHTVGIGRFEYGARFQTPTTSSDGRALIRRSTRARLPPPGPAWNRLTVGRELFARRRTTRPPTSSEEPDLINLADGLDTRAADPTHRDVGTWPGLISPRNKARLLGGALRARGP